LSAHLGVGRGAVQLLQTHKLLVGRNAQDLERVETLQNALIQNNEIELAIKRLTQAHVAQQAFRQSLEVGDLFFFFFFLYVFFC
jgi:hypothetical protein